MYNEKRESCAKRKERVVQREKRELYNEKRESCTKRKERVVQREKRELYKDIGRERQR